MKYINFKTGLLRVCLFLTVLAEALAFSGERSEGTMIFGIWFMELYQVVYFSPVYIWTSFFFILWIAKGFIGQRVPLEYKEAVRWYCHSAEQKFIGQEISQDYEEAVRLYRLSAEQGNDEAQYNLGLMYTNGLGVPQSYRETNKWFRLSAEQGNSLAQYNLGLMYACGLGAPQDHLLAHMWLNITGSNGNKNAVKNRDIIEKRMSPSQIEKAQDMARN